MFAKSSPFLLEKAANIAIFILFLFNEQNTYRGMSKKGEDKGKGAYNEDNLYECFCYPFCL